MREIVPGSARGARVGGACSGVIGIVAVFLGSASVAPDLTPWLFSLIFVYWVCRPLLMGVFLGESDLIVKSWYRNYHIPYASLTAVNVAPYAGLVAKTPVGYIPLIGAISTVELELDGGRTKDFPCTVGRLRTVLEVRRAIRAAAGMTQPRFDIADPDTF